ncbi:hypothetical protein [Streptacidiphilus cavernicola]|uniref:Uncharacterized protein n=1 Tax=Streptacidiphilus cavernicola TaxID=3342716 RepID=A0ABV6VR02_9ACTN
MNDTTRTPAAQARRSRRLRSAAVATVLTAGLLGFGLAPATATTAAPKDDLLVGTWTWDVTVQAPSGPSVSVTGFVFHPDHTFNATNPDGSGFWIENDRGEFALYVTHGSVPNGVIPGTIQAVHIGVVTKKHEHSSAYAFVQSPDGTRIGPVTVTSTGVKTSNASG